MSEPESPDFRFHPEGGPETPRGGGGLSWREFCLAAVLATALLAAAATPLLRDRENARIAGAHLAMREAAQGIEAYFVDHEAFPPCGLAGGPARFYPGQNFGDPTRTAEIPAGVATANAFAPAGSRARDIVTFRIAGRTPDGGLGFASLTTPVAYTADFPRDPFARTPDAVMGYFAHATNLGFILYSLGPDRDENAPDGPGDLNGRIETFYNLSESFPHMWTPGPELTGATYDPTNGLWSDGDIARWVGR